MAADRVLPQVLLTKNPWRGTNTYILLTFCGLCLSQVLIMKGNVDALAGIYSLSFLGVMATFTVGCILLARSRRKKPSPSPSVSSSFSIPMLPYWHLFLALSLVLLALWANLFGKGTEVAILFLAYFLPLYFTCLTCLYVNNMTNKANANSQSSGAFGSEAIVAP